MYVCARACVRVQCSDRKAILAHGHVRCVGSSLFLKNRFGLGYILNITQDDDVEEHRAHLTAITAAVQAGVPSATLEKDVANEATYRLPLSESHSTGRAGTRAGRSPAR